MPIQTCRPIIHDRLITLRMASSALATIDQRARALGQCRSEFFRATVTGVLGESA